jgi:hypothetical protein
MLSAFGTDVDGGIAHLLDNLKTVAAGIAGILIRWHFDNTS